MSEQKPKYREVDSILIGLKYRVIDKDTEMYADGTDHFGIEADENSILAIKLLDEVDILELGFKHTGQEIEAEDATIIDTYELDEIILNIMFPEQVASIAVVGEIMFNGYIESQMDLMALVRCASGYLTKDNG